MVTMAADPASTVASEGYWLASADGGVYPEGSAPYHGGVSNLPLNAPIVGMAAMPTARATG